MMRRVLICTVACAIILAAAPVFAQQRLFAVTPSAVVELDSRLPSLGRIVRRTPLSAQAPRRDDVVPAAGGAFLAWTTGAGTVVLFDTRTSVAQSHSVPGFFATKLLGSGAEGHLVVQGYRPETTVPGGVTAQVLIADLRTGSFRLVDFGSPYAVGATAYAARTQLLFVGGLHAFDVARSSCRDPDN